MYVWSTDECAYVVLWAKPHEYAIRIGIHVYVAAYLFLRNIFLENS